MQKLCCVRTRQHPLPVWSHKFVLSSLTHFSTNSRPFLVGIVPRSDKESSGDGNNETFAMTCFEDEEDDKNEMGMMKTSLNQRILKMMKEKWVLEHPGTLKNPKEPHRRSRRFLRLKSRTNGQ